MGNRPFLFSKGYYDIGAYVFTKSIVDMPFMLVSTIIFAIVLLPIANLQYAGIKFILFVLALFLVQLNAQSLGLFYASVLMDDKMITVLGPMLIMPVSL